METTHAHHRSRRHRRHQAVFFDLTDTADERFDRIIEVLLVVLLAFAPIAMGAVQAWSETVVVCLVAAMCLCLGVKLMRRPDVPFVWSWTYLPIAAFLALTALQLAPLPASALRIISPNSVALRESLLGPLPGSQEHLRVMPLSLYPEATASNLRLLLAVCGVYIVTLNVVRQAAQIRRMLLAVTAIGAGVALIGLAHLIFGVGLVYGRYGVETSWTMGPFINRNHLGQFMNLSLGAATALLVTQVAQLLRERRHSRSPRTTSPDSASPPHAPSDPSPVKYWSMSGASRSSESDDEFPQVPPLLWWLAGAVVLLAVCVLFSLSRGAALGLAVSAAVAVAVGRRRDMGLRLWLLLPVAWAVAVAVLAFGFEALSDRVAKITDVESHSIQGRIILVRDLLRGWLDFPILGTGLGTFEFTFPMLDRSKWLSLATHAENEYAQVLLEGGVVGLGLVLVFLAMIARAYVRCARSAPSPMATAAVGLGLGLLAVLLQSLTDFGQHIPGVATLTAVTCALLVTLARASRQTSPLPQAAAAPAQIDSPDSTQRERGPRRATARIGATVVVAAVALWAVVDSIELTRAENRWSQARFHESMLMRRQWRGTESDFQPLLVAAADAALLRPGDIRYQYWLNFFRWKYISLYIDPRTRKPSDEQVYDWTVHVVSELLAAAPRCPTYGPVYTLAGLIQRNLLNQRDAGAALVRTGYRLSRADPAANFEAAMVDAEQGLWEDAMGKFRHAAELHREFKLEAVDALVMQFRRSDLAMELAGEDGGAIARIVQNLEQVGDAEGAARATQRRREVVLSLAAPVNAPAEALLDAARLASADGDYPAAVQFYRRAVLLDYVNAGLRLELARALAGAGESEEALREARAARALGSAAAERFVMELQLRPATRSAATSTSAPAR
jgi:O-antigen ligase